MKELKSDSFIYEFPNIISKEICEDIIKRFEKDKVNHYRGRIGQKLDEDLDIKRSTDLFISGKDEWKDVDQIFFDALKKAMIEIKNKIDFFNGPFKDMGYAIQRTDKEEFYHWHIDGGSHEFSYRQLVAIFYLNTLSDEDGGTTEFFHQKINVKPEVGKLILFPPFWTHKHRGRKVELGKKYIATTWIVFA
ncbi:MAG: 2OG-Fe(II) oxygenase [Pseudomonadota bacterium]|nr:2OG-Fe(II) oxygenase [Pseudomonadota bacterium]|tara:strand:- start:1566 stop:2138 length:573 start_codon:yes stop_codon:yes gene_type:complete